LILPLFVGILFSGVRLALAGGMETNQNVSRTNFPPGLVDKAARQPYEKGFIDVTKAPYGADAFAWRELQDTFLAAPPPCRAPPGIVPQNTTAEATSSTAQATSSMKTSLDSKPMSHILKCIEYMTCLGTGTHAEGKAMSEVELTRIKDDLAIMQRAMGLHLPFGKGMLGVGIVLTISALAAAAVSLWAEADWLQLAPLVAIMVLGLVGVFLQSRRIANLSPEITLQIVLSVTIYAVVWVSACGYSLATFLGPTVGMARTVGLYAIGVGSLFAFSLILVHTALKSRERYYCLGLAVSLLLAGMLVPIFDRHYSYPLAHSFMAIGYLTGVAIQWVQLRKAVTYHAAD
jgi:hypothetical protein